MNQLDNAHRLLHGHRHRKIPFSKAMKRAAVAAVLRQRDSLELLFIRRAEHPDDPWSGHMAFPGGRVDSTDASPLAAAIRETKEELDFDLEPHARLAGPLSHVTAVAWGKPLPLIILPFAFTTEGTTPLTPNYEVQEALWVPLPFLADRANRDSMTRTYMGMSVELPCYRYRGRLIWGLTLRMADELLEVVRPVTAPAKTKP